MQDIRLKLLWLGISLTIFCGVIALAISLTIALTFAIAVILVYLIAQTYWAYRLQTWLANPTIDTLPEGNNHWEEIFLAIYQIKREHAYIEKELTDTLDNFRHTMNTLPDGIVVLNQRNEINWCNPPAEMQFGLDLSKDINQPVHNFIRYALFIEYLHQTNHSETIQLKSLRHAEMTLQIQLIPFGIDQKLLISRDITASEKNDIMRRDFIANVSHELRTPLTVVGGFLETLSDTKGSVPESIQRYFDIMMDQTSRMRLIVEDLLTLSRIESNTEPPKNKVIKMPALLKMMLNNANALSNGKHKIHLTAEKNLNITGNQDELLSAFTNLVTNAIRYTPEGGNVSIDWQAYKGEAVFSVLDTGIGIEQHHIDRLTERFYRVDHGRSRNTGGTGLGLAIVKHIVQHHKAKLEIVSDIGIGSTFSILIPSSRVVRKEIIDKQPDKPFAKNIPKKNTKTQKPSKQITASKSNDKNH